MSSSETDAAEQVFRNRSAMVLEDDELTAMAIAEELKALGFAQVFTVVNPVTGTVVLKAEAVDVAILDIHLASSRTSFDLADELAEQNVPFVFASASAAEVPERFAAVPFLLKPVETMALGQALLHALGRKGLNKAMRINPRALCPCTQTGSALSYSRNHQSSDTETDQRSTDERVDLYEAALQQVTERGKHQDEAAGE